MNCIKCGNELPDGASFCTSCGAPQPKPAESPAAIDTQESNPTRPPEIYIQQPQPQQTFVPAQPAPKPKKKGGFLKVLAILVLALVLISGVTVLSYFTFLPAKYTLMVAEYSSVLNDYDTFDKNAARYEEKAVKPIYENTIQKQSELSFSIDDSLLEQLGVPTDTVSLISQALKNVSIKYGSALDMKNKKQTLSFAVNPVLTLNMFVDKTKFGVGIPELTKKTIVGDLKELDKLAEIYPDIDTEILDAYKDMDPWISGRIHDEIKINREDIKKVMMDYSREIINSIDAGDMSIARGQKVEVLGKDMSCQEITIELDQKAQKKIFSNLLSRLEDDDNVYNLTAGNILKLYDILGESEMYKQLLQGVDVEEELSKDNYKDYIADLRKNLDESTLPEEVTAKVYIKGLDVVKYVFDFNTGNPDEDVTMTIEDVSKGLSYEQKYTIAGGVQDESGEITLSLKKDYKESSDTTNYTADFNVDMNMPDNSGNVSFTLESLEDPDGKNTVNHTVNAALKMDITSYGAPTQGEFNFKLDGSKTRNSKDLVTESDYKGNVNVNIPSELPQPVSVDFALKTDTTYGEKVAIEEPSETLDISTATQADYDELSNEINEKVGSLMMMFGGY